MCSDYVASVFNFSFQVSEIQIIYFASNFKKMLTLVDNVTYISDFHLTTRKSSASRVYVSMT